MKDLKYLCLSPALIPASGREKTLVSFLLFTFGSFIQCLEPELFKIRLTAEEPQYTEEVGKDASLSCLGEPVKNDPFTWVYWELNGTRLNTSTHHYDDSRIYSNSNNGATPKVHMKLIIFNVDYSDEGNYTCVVYSFSERVSDSISLQIKELQKGRK